MFRLCANSGDSHQIIGTSSCSRGAIAYGIPCRYNPLLTERFAVVGHIHQRNVVLVALRLQECNQLRQDVIGVAQRVVVRIDDLLLRAVMQHIGLARRLKVLELWWIAAVVRRAMVADLMKHEHHVARLLPRKRVQVT